MKLKLLLTILCATIFLISGIFRANLYAKDAEPPVNPKVQDRYLVDVLKELSEKYQVIFSYKTQLLEGIVVDYEIKNEESLEISINRLLTETGLSYKFLGSKYYVIYKNNKRNKKHLKKLSRRIHQIQNLEEKGGMDLQPAGTNGFKRISAISKSIQQLRPLDKSISGTVQDENGNPLNGATVLAKGTKQGALTDGQGKFQLVISDEVTTLIVSYIGYATQRVEIGDQTVINVTLAESTSTLDEVVVTAFGIEREKKALGYSVQQIGGEELVEAREINVANSLKGKIAGVFVNSSSGGPGGSAFVQIRGSSSLDGKNQPLYVVDGIPISNDNLNQTRIFSGRDFGDGIKDINPDDIESISVLKGPNAAAIYGSRGANGVILITTKKSKRKGLGVSFNSNATFESINVFPKYQSSYGQTYDDTDAYFGKTTIDGVEYDVVPGWAIDNWGPPLDGRLVILPRLADLGPVPFVARQDNLRDFYNTGTTYTNTIAVDGGSEKVTYRVSASNMDNKGIIPNAEFSRRTFSLRFGADVTDRLHIEAKANYINSVGKNRPIIGVSSSRNVAGSLNLTPPNINLSWLKNYKNPDGSHRNWRSSPANPYWIVNEFPSKDSRDRLIGLISATYQVADWLSIMGRVGNDTYTESQRQQYNIGTPGGAYRNGRVDFNQYRVNELNADVLITANGKLSTNFSGSVSFGANKYRRSRETAATIGRDMNVPDVYTIENSNLVIPFYEFRAKEIQSVYMTGQLVYKSYLFLDLTARNDWSSTLGRENYSFFYPSASLSYVITDAFDITSNVLTFAKLRASYAQAGNDTDPFRTQGGYSVGTQLFKGQRFASINGTVPPTSLRNELSTSIEFGTDIRLFDNRLSIDFTYYDSRTTDQILPIGIPSSTGYQGLFLNAGEVSNKGIELFISAVPLQLDNSLRWEIGINFSKNKSIVEELVEGIERLDFITTGPASIVAIPGQPYGTIFGFKYKTSPDGTRVVHESGNYYMREDEQSILGDVQPDFLAGVTNTISFKGFSLSALIDIRKGGEIYSFSRQDQNAKGTGIWTDNRDNLVVEGVIDNGDGTYTPTSQTVWSQNFYAQRSWQNIGEEFVIDATYAALREATLDYTFSQGLLSKTPFRTARLSVVGRNLLYLTRAAKFKEMGVSPESAFAPTAAAQGYEAFSMPTTRSMGVNLSLTF